MPNQVYRNISLANILIRNPSGALGVLLGDENSWIEGLSFDSVRAVQAPLTITHEDILEMFPALQHTPDDWFARRTSLVFYFMELFAVGIFIVVIVMVFFRKERFIPQEHHGNDFPSFIQFLSRRLESLSNRSLKVLLFVSKAAIFLSALLIVHNLSLIPKVSSPRRYFICQGIHDGVATGFTFPIPSCFKDMTTHKHAFEGDKLDSPVAFYQAFVFLVLVALILCYLFSTQLISDAMHQQSLYELLREQQQEDGNLELVNGVHDGDLETGTRHIHASGNRISATIAARRRRKQQMISK